MLCLSIALAAPLQAQPEPTPTPAAPAPIFAVPTVQLPLKAEKPVATGIAEILRARFPLAINYADLGAGWREVTYQGNIYYTKGDTAQVNDDEYVIAYKFAGRINSTLSEREYIAGVTGNGPPFQSEDRFEITLLQSNSVLQNLINGQTNLRSFFANNNRSTLDPTTYSDAFNQNLSQIYLRKIGEAVNAYTEGHLGVLPPLETAYAARKALTPYAENAVIFTQPGTDQPFKTNPLFSNKKRQHLSKRRNAVLIYEAQAGSDGLRGVLLVNGNVSRVTQKQWARLVEISQ